MFNPKLFDILRQYSFRQFGRDLMAGVIVGIVALPLAVAFAIASGVSPEKGLFTAVIAGFIISALGGSRVQIGGPTGAFIVIVYGIVQVHGLAGLIAATFMAGCMLIIMGFSKLGSIIKFIPYPLIIGFTSGIALIIFSSQFKDAFGLPITNLPADFSGKWQSYWHHINKVNWYALGVTLFTIAVGLLWPTITRKFPGSLIAISATAWLVHVLHLPVETIGDRFGAISYGFPSLSKPGLNFASIQKLIQPAFTIALLGAIESLLSAVVADGMTGDEHDSNTELIAQGTANIFSSLFGGIPATGAIARTATNIKNGGRTPVAGLMHAITLLVIILFAGKLVTYIPMATLAGILIIVAYNMSEWETFVSMLKGSRKDAAVLLITFVLTTLVDLSVAIEIGMVLAGFLFMRTMIQLTNVKWLTAKTSIPDYTLSVDEVEGIAINKHVEVFEIRGPLFFGAVYKFKDAMKLVESPPKILIIRMRQVPMIDATGLKAIEEFYKEATHRGTKIILSEVKSEQVMEALKNARLLFKIGKANVTVTFDDAIRRCKTIFPDHHI
ncbi:SulP family inorganic anion transporter [Pinibacter soli]|uniref:Sulfate permease n=1 Tax=Pinibacter soli TaxID=3044211 RepID=A0ABT6RAM0_9BACT|nr:sulfate permease [Pinibacter soli]MDI3319446.1 sulfate permease [Pinibacter soli]